ncbi:MAG: type II toxin-antitoxin system RelE/ParE family toxin [Candidatus Hatepunaea meridiana]|nr:type II toxin-antitoxin system RelE/ParE family toxin [Candidatus Hatepunaea meridiana]
MWNIQFIIKGHYCEIGAMEKRSRCEVTDLLNKLEKTDEAVYNSILTLLERIAQIGPPCNRTQFRYLGNKISEIKVKNLRIFCFYQPSLKVNRLLILSHGWAKGTKKEQNRQIKIAEKRYTELFS